MSSYQGCNESLKFWVESSHSFGLILGFESSRTNFTYKFQWDRVTEYCSSHWYVLVCDSSHDSITTLLDINNINQH